jgi:hypothetical protein
MSEINKQYANVSVTESLIKRLELDKDKAVGMARYGRFKAWLHYANLQSWQNQGLHFRYLNNAGKEHWCTCGLVVPIGCQPDVKGLAELELDEVHVAFGHKNLPSLRGQAKAFIYNFLWVEGSPDKHFNHGTYHYSAFCQACLEHVKDLPAADADAFVKAHKKCRGRTVSD